MTIIEILKHKLSELHPKSKTMLIAIDGRGGSGKSTLSEKLKQGLPNVTVVHLDDFAYPNTDRQRLLRAYLKSL